MHFVLCVTPSPFSKRVCATDCAFLGCARALNFLPSVVFSHSLIRHLHSDLPLFACVFWCVCLCACPSTCPACFVSLQSADKDTVPAQLFSASLASAAPGVNLLFSPPPHLTSPPSPSLPGFSAPIINLLFALDTLLLLHPLHTFPPLCSLLLMSKLKTSHCQTIPRLSHALLGEEHSGWKNSLSLKIG